IRLRSRFESCGRSHTSPKRTSSVRSTSLGANSPRAVRAALGRWLFISFVSSRELILSRVPECGSLRGRVDVLPGAAARDLTIAANHVEPFRFAEVRVLGSVLRGLQNPLGDVAEREVGD